MLLQPTALTPLTSCLSPGVHFKLTRPHHPRKPSPDRMRHLIDLGDDSAAKMKQKHCALALAD